MAGCSSLEIPTGSIEKGKRGGGGGCGGRSSSNLGGGPVGESGAAGLVSNTREGLGNWVCKSSNTPDVYA